MAMLRRPQLLLLLAGLIAGAGPVAFAGEAGRDDDKQNRADQNRADQSRADQDRQEPPRQGEDTLSDAVRRVERATQGQILSAERVQFDGRDIHRVKVVDVGGRVRIYVDDPEKPAKSSDDKPARTRRDDNDDPNL